MQEQKENPAKIFLRGYKALLLRRESLLREVERMRESLTGTTVQLKQDVVTGGCAVDRIGNIVPAIVDAEAVIRPELDEINRRIRIIFQAIDSVPDEMQKTVLTMRYIECLDWLHIQERISYEERQTFVIHGRALAHINTWLNKRAQENAVVNVVECKRQRMQFGSDREPDASCAPSFSGV